MPPRGHSCQGLPLTANGHFSVPQELYQSKSWNDRNRETAGFVNSAVKQSYMQCTPHVLGTCSCVNLILALPISLSSSSSFLPEFETGPVSIYLQALVCMEHCLFIQIFGGELRPVPVSKSTLVYAYMDILDQCRITYTHWSET